MTVGCISWPTSGCVVRAEGGGGTDPACFAGTNGVPRRGGGKKGGRDQATGGEGERFQRRAMGKVGHRPYHSKPRRWRSRKFADASGGYKGLSV